MWTLHEDCKNIVSDCWNKNFVGFPMFILSQKLKLLKQILKNWNINVFGNVRVDAEIELTSIQNQIDTSGMSDSLLDQQKLAHIKLEKDLDKEEAIR